MGIVNVTPDSFSDGGLYLDCAAAVDHGLALERAGATILDVGGESTRPGANPVPEDEELRRVVPVIEGLRARRQRRPASIDTSKAPSPRAALAAGATLVNDVTALRGDPDMAYVIAAGGADCCLMHMLGEPRTMQRDPRYGDVVSEVKAFLEERLAVAVAAGVAGADPARPRDRLWQDHRTQPRVAAAAGRARRRRPADRDRHLAQVVSGQDHRPARRGPDRRHDRHQRGRLRAWRARVPRPRRRPDPDALAITAATVGAAWETTTPTSSTMSTT